MSTMQKIPIPVKAETPDEVDPLEREYDDASQWPDTTDDDRWELTDPTDPSPEDRSFWAAETEASARIDRSLDGLAEEADALARLCEGLSAPDSAACWTVELEGRRWMVRRDGRSMFASNSEADARGELAHRRAGESRSRAVSGFDDFDRQRTGAI